MRNGISDAELFPAWFLEVLEMNEHERKELVEEILDAVSREGSLNDKPTKSGLDLVKMLDRDCELVGFDPQCIYTKVEAKPQDLRVKFVHKFGYPTLVYKHKKLPIVLSVNPGLRKDRMILAEIPQNRKIFEGVYVVGITS